MVKFNESKLKILKNLLHKDGILFVQIDDYEMAYLQFLLDEIFGRNLRLNTIAVKMSEVSGVKMAHAKKRLPKLKEYILAYKKSEEYEFKNIIKIPVDKWNEEYKTYLENFTIKQREDLRSFMEKEINTDDDINKVNQILENVVTISISKKLTALNIIKEEEINNWKIENSWRIIQSVGSSSVKNYALMRPILNQDIAALLSAKNLLYLYNTNFNKDTKSPRIQVLFADDNLLRNPGDFWTDIKTTGGVGQEGNVDFPNSKKPEKLINRIIQLTTNEGDLVLDSFLGSGTTAAVAHKMKRKFIGIELGEHAKTHCYPRLKAVVDGEQGGISKAVNWQGGGGFKFYTLAPSLLKQDKFGNWVISPEYNADMLAAAMAKQEGFNYLPHEEKFWKQGNSSENDFIFTTTQFITRPVLEAILEELQDDQSLLLCCVNFEAGLEHAYPNINLRKIPAILLNRCQFDHDDYSLNIINSPFDELRPEIATPIAAVEKYTTQIPDLFTTNTDSSNE